VIESLIEKLKLLRLKAFSENLPQVMEIAKQKTGLPLLTVSSTTLKSLLWKGKAIDKSKKELKYYNNVGFAVLLRGDGLRALFAQECLRVSSEPDSMFLNLRFGWFDKP